MNINKRRNGCKNVCKKFCNGQVTGHGIIAAYEIPMSCFSRKSDIDNQLFELRQLIHELLEMHASPKSTYEHVLETVKKILDVLKTDEEETNKSNQILCEYGVVEVLSETLLEDIFGMNGDPKSTAVTSCPDARIEDAQNILSLMAKAMMDSDTNYHHVRWNHHLIEVLLSFLTTDNPLRSLASIVLEEALLGNDQPPIFLNKLSGLQAYLEKITFTQFEAPFFHLLSTFMSDAEYTASSNSMLEKHDHWLALRSSEAVEANHRFILGVPNFLEGLCGSIKKSSSNLSPTPIVPPANLSSFHDLFDILQYLVAQPGMIDAENSHDIPGVQYVQQFQLQSKKIFLSDIFHILSLLLLGKYRSEVQQRLVDYNFFPFLIDPVETIVWNKAPMAHIQELEHEEINTDAVAQIQFLRLLHAIADNHANRYYLLTASEITDLIRLAKARNYELPPDLEKFDISKSPTGEKGVLSLVVEKLQAEHEKSIIRFWIARAMEAFLRGETSAAHQLFLINKNVIEDCVKVLLSCAPKHEMVLQGSFDFLSTVMRNNPEAFQRFEAAIDCTAKFIQLVKEVDDHLIDSNMFLRCVILTNYKKRKSGDFGSSRLLDWYLNTDTLLGLIAKLIRLLSVPTLSQENVSCLNTTILVLYLAEQDSILPKYLLSLSELNDGQSLIGNLKNLLQFWRSHYTLPTKKMDRKNLELSTGISFSQWCQFVDLLLGIEPGCTRTLRHYLRDKKLPTTSLFRRNRIP